MAPTYDSTVDKHSKKATAEREGMEEKDSMVVKQTWRKSGSCPKGTIPIRRIRKHVLLKADSIERYGRKRPTSSLEITQLSNSRSSHFLLMNHSVRPTNISFPLNSMFFLLSLTIYLSMLQNRRHFCLL